MKRIGKRGRPCRRVAALNGQLALAFDETLEALCAARAAVRCARRLKNRHQDDQMMLRLLRNVERSVKPVSEKLRSVAGELTEVEEDFKQAA